jgi:hypothetical protein
VDEYLIALEPTTFGDLKAAVLLKYQLIKPVTKTRKRLASVKQI